MTANRPPAARLCPTCLQRFCPVTQRLCDSCASAHPRTERRTTPPKKPRPKLPALPASFDGLTLEDAIERYGPQSPQWPGEP